MGWMCNGVPKDGQAYPSSPHDSIENPDTAESCFKCELPRSAVDSRKAEELAGYKPQKRLSPWALGLMLVALAGVGVYSLLQTDRANNSPSPLSSVSPSPTDKVTQSPQGSPSPSVVAVSDNLKNKISSGDRPLFKDASYAQRDDGIRAFSEENYNQALEYFEKAVQSTPNQPEPDIYLNNTKARIAGNPYIIATVVPITQSADQAREMLRGVADAQRLFNDRGGVNDRLLEVVIADDENNSTIAKQVAQTLVETYKDKLLAVIGHNSSDASAAALSVYESANIVMISPTSTSTKLSGSTFFRTVASDSKSGEVLADYINNNVQASTVGVFYVSTSTYSASLYEAFLQNFRGKVDPYDFSNQNFDVGSTLNRLAEDRVDTIVLFPNVSQRDRALGIAKIAEKKGLKFRLFGGDALYTSQTLLEGQSAIDELILVVPWFADGDYAKIADKRWQGQISWRTASAYDATQSLLRVLDMATQPVQSSETILENLKKADFSVPKQFTSGEPVFFDVTGNRKIKPILVKVKAGEPGPSGTKFGFTPIP